MITMCAVLFGGASSAWAGVGFSMVPTVPQDVTVGETGVRSSLIITNRSANGFGETGYATDSYRLTRITLVPSCASPNFGEDCPVGAYDPGVLVPSPLTAQGRDGTACAGTTFTITTAPPGDPAMGKYSFVPSAPVILGPATGGDEVRQCIIDYTATVLKAPRDSDGDPSNGLQTEQKASTAGIDIGPLNTGKTGGGVGTAGTTIALRTPQLATNASAPIVLGAGELTDLAIVSDLVSPVTSGPGAGTVIFRLYGPDDGSCATAIFTSAAKPLNYSSATRATASSGTFTPTAAGTYRWRASYSGDANNAPVAGACDEPNESTVVSKATPAITTDASNDMKIGGQLTDVATITGRNNPIGSSSVTFRLYGPNDSDCTGTAVFTSTVSVPASPVSPVSVTSGAYTPTAVGMYRWVASYSGDANNAAVAGACNDANENTDVTKATPAITTDASNDMKIGGQLTDVATIRGRVSPSGSSSVTFRLYGPNDANCTATAVFTSTVSVPASPVSPVSVTSGAYTPTAIGMYRWVASYSGDNNNAAVAGACNDADENTDVTKATPAITTDASNAMKIGGELTDVATITGRASPVGVSTVTFRLYGPNDAQCTANPVFMSTRNVPASPVTPVSVTSEAYTPTVVGTYRWVASYSGDASNAAAEGACNDANENTDVNKATPAITTQASPDMVFGSGTLTDTATVAGLVNPIKGAGEATIDFRLYGANDTTCQTAVFTSTNRPLTFNAQNTEAKAMSAPYTPPTVGTYRWRAFYSGDANNDATNGACNAPNESTDVRLTSPTIETQASPEIVLGAGTLTDTATVSGLVDPIVAGPGAGTVEFRLYGPDDASCTTAIFPTAARPLTLNQGRTVATASSTAYTPTAAGVYRWRAFYSGDANNNSVSGACTDVNEQTTVKPPPVTPPPAVAPPPPPPVAVAPVIAPPPVAPPARAVLPASVESPPRGTAAIRGRTGCQGSPFQVTVSGRQIEQVIFTMDGKIVRVLTRPNSGNRYVLPVNPRTKKTGIHRVLARIVFTKESGTRSRTLRVVYSRCARRAASPAFTG